MKIFIDGDGSPVKEDIFQISEAFGLETVLVTSVDHFSNRDFPENVSVIYVDRGADSADFRLISEIRAGDILVTQDYGLASIALPKQVVVLHQLGFEYTQENIDSLLTNRFIGQMERKAGRRTKGPKPFSKEDHDTFQQKLIRVIQRVKNKEKSL